MSAVNQWVTVETLSAAAISVASVGDAPRGFADVRRVLQRLLSKTPEHSHGLTTRHITNAIHAVHQRAAAVELAIPVRVSRLRLVIRPVLGPTRQVHAVRLWLGAADVPVPEPRPAAGFIWRADTQMIHLPERIGPLLGMDLHTTRCSIAELFHHISGFTRHAEVLDLLYAPASGDKLQFDVVLNRGSARPGHWRITIRARDNDRAGEVWWLAEDVTADATSSTKPLLEEVGLREAHRRAGTHLAIVHLPYPSIAHWLTEPAAWIRWNSLPRPVEVFHPEDRAALSGLADRLRSGETAAITVRTLAHDGGYARTSLSLYPYPGYSTHQLTIAQFVPVHDRSVSEMPCGAAVTVAAGPSAMG
ncbi:GAF domain-containing protein [Nocardia thraciensis]